MDTNKHSGRGAHDVPSVCKMEGEDGNGRFHDLDTGELRSFLALPKKWDTLALAAEESRDFKVCLCVCACVWKGGGRLLSRLCACLCVYACTCVCVCVFVCVCVVFMFEYIYQCT